MAPTAPLAHVELQAGADLSLRPLHPRDATALFRLVDGSRARLRQWLGFVDNTRSPFDTAGFVRGAMAQARLGVGHHFAIRLGSTLIGVVGYRRPDPYPTLQIGYWLGEGFEGRGLMTAACRALIAHAFAVGGAHRVEIRAATGNRRSRAIPERLGFRLEGILREAEALPDQGWVDHCVYAVTLGDWTHLGRARPAQGSAERLPGALAGSTRPRAPLALPPAVRDAAAEAALDAEMATYYEARAPEYDDWYERRGRYADPQTDAAWFAELAQLQAAATGFAAALPPRAQVLDIACGTGRWTAALAERRDLAVAGLDQAPAMLAEAQARLDRLGLRATLVQGDALRLPFPTGAFDAAVSGFLFDHLTPEQRGAFLAEVRRTVRRGGRLLLLESRLELRHSGDLEVQERALSDGRRFRVRKGLFTAETLREALAPLGTAEARESAGYFVWAAIDL